MKRIALIASVLLLASVFMAPAFAGENEQTDGPKLEDTAKLSVRGEAQLERPADQVKVNIGVTTEAKLAADALEQNNEKIADVLAAMKSAGLTEKEYQTGRFRIRPKYSMRPRQPKPEWKPTIIGYEVVNSITVKTKKLKLVGDIIHDANEAGANDVNVSEFNLADKRAYRSEAILEATSNAMADARDLAAAAGLRLVRIISINLDNTPIRTPDMQMSARGRAMAEAGTVPIAPGEVTIRANVVIVFEIEPLEVPAP